MAKADTIQVLNVLQPGKTYSANREKYEDMKQAVVKALPKTTPGMTVEELGKAVLPHLSQEHFPGGEKSGWWIKCIQLDLEARGTIQRENSKPLRLHRV